MRLSEVPSGRHHNNFNIVRVLAASGVLVAHSFALSIGPGGEASAEVWGFRFSSIGSLSVDVFFVVSGFLVTSSLLSRANVRGFLLARALRVFPALWVMLLFTVFGLGGFFTALPLREYLSSPAVYLYLAKSGTVLGNVGDTLPGVFEANPFPRAANGSLWTLPYEVHLYLGLLVLWLFCRPARMKSESAFKACCGFCALLAGVATVAADAFPLNAAGEASDFLIQLAKLSFMFFSGATYYLFRDKIPLSPLIAGMLAASFLIAGRSAAAPSVAYLLAVPYLVIYIAYGLTPRLFLRYNTLGDYSYGLYIYAFPVQQAIAALIPGVSAGTMLVLSLLFTTPLSIASWHLVEQRALGFKTTATTD